MILIVQILELFEGLKIKVTDDGRVFTLDKHVIRKNGRADNRKGKELKASINKYGYKQVTLSKNHKRKTYTVHRLVAMAFLENPYNKETVNHIDGNKLNNCVSNLEWATNKEQKQHAIKNELCTKNSEALENANKRRSIKVLYNGKIYESISAACIENKIHYRVVRRDGVIL